MRSVTVFVCLALTASLCRAAILEEEVFSWDDFLASAQTVSDASRGGPLGIRLCEDEQFEHGM